MSPVDGGAAAAAEQESAAETSTGSSVLPWSAAGGGELESAIGTAGLGADGESSDPSAAGVDMMEQAQQMMAQMEAGTSSAAQEQPEPEPRPGLGRCLSTAGALKLSNEEMQQRQTNNVFKAIRQQMRGDRSLYGQKLADAKRVFALMDKDGSGTMSIDEFRDALARMGLGLTSDQVGEVLQAVDADGNGTVEYDEFIGLLGAERPSSATTDQLPRRRRCRVTSAGVARSRKVYGNRDALGFEEPPDLAAYRHVPVYQSCFPVYTAKMFQKAAPDLATSSNRPTPERQESYSIAPEVADATLDPLLGVPDDPINSKTVPATMHARHAIDFDQSAVPRAARPSSAAPSADRTSGGSATGGRPPAGRRRPQSAASNLQKKSLTMSDESKIEREVENVFRVISAQLRGKRTLYGEVMAEARDVFNLIDKDRSRTLDKHEFTTALKRMGLGLTERQVEEVIAVVDKDGNGTIEYPEFVALLGAEWNRPRSAPPVKNRFGQQQRSRSAGSRRGRLASAVAGGSNASRRSSAGSRRPGSAPMMDRYAASPQHPFGWKPRTKPPAGQIQHVPAQADSDTSYWGWQETAGAPGHKTWIDGYKGGVAVEQLTPRRAAWDDKIKREAARAERPVNLGWCESTMTVDSMDRPASAPPRNRNEPSEIRQQELEAAKNQHFSRWKPAKKRNPERSRHLRELAASKNLEPIQQEVVVQTDPLAAYYDYPAVAVEFMAAGGFPESTKGCDVTCRVKFGKHELDTPALPHPLPEELVPHPLPDDQEPVCLFGKKDHSHLDNFLLVDCFSKEQGESRSTHRGSLRLALRDSRTSPDMNPNAVRFFKLADRSEVAREAETPNGRPSQLKRYASFGFSTELGDEGMDFKGTHKGPKVPLSRTASGVWNEVFPDLKGAPPPETCPAGWIALKVYFTEQAGSTKGKTRKSLENAAELLTQADRNSIGTLSITICKGRRLPLETGASRSKMLDPVCQVQYRTENVSTSVAFNTVTPSWDETFMFDVVDLNEELRIMVHDWKADAEGYNLVGASALGMVEELDIINSFDSIESERWVELFTLRSDGTVRRRGDIFCRMVFTPRFNASPIGTGQSIGNGPSPRSSLLIGTSVHSICMQLECLEVRGVLVPKGTQLCCSVSLYQPLHENQVKQTAPVEMHVEGEGEDTSECVCTFTNATVNLSWVEPTAVVCVDVMLPPERTANGFKAGKILGGFVVPAAHLLQVHKKGEWFQLVDGSGVAGSPKRSKPPAAKMPSCRNFLQSRIELDGPATGNPVNVDFNSATHTHAAAMYYEAEHAVYRPRRFEDVQWKEPPHGMSRTSGRHFDHVTPVTQAAIHIKCKLDVKPVERVSSKSPKGFAPPGSMLDELAVGAVSIAVVRAAGLSKVRGTHGLKEPDPYVAVLHGSDQFITPTIKQTRSPTWDGANEQQWFTFPVETVRSVVQFKIMSYALVGPDILLGSLSIGLREMVSSASMIGTELPEPMDEKVVAEHRLLGVSELQEIALDGKKKTRIKLEENGILGVATHLQLRSLEENETNMRILPATRRLRSIVLTTDFLMNDSRFRVANEKEEGDVLDFMRHGRAVSSQRVAVAQGAFECVEVSVLECSALRMSGIESGDERWNDQVKPLVRLRLVDKLPVPNKNDGSDEDKDMAVKLGHIPGTGCKPGHAPLTEEYKKWLDSDAEVLIVVMNMQCIFRGKLARKDFKVKSTSLERTSDEPTPCSFDPEPFRLQTNDFSQRLVCEVLHKEPGLLPVLLGSVEIPVSSLSLPSCTGDHWHMLTPPVYSNAWHQAEMAAVATRIQASFRAWRQRRDFNRRKDAPIHMVYMLGGPGSGKTTLGKLLVEDLGLVHLSVGEMLRRALRQKEHRDIANTIRVCMADGQHVGNQILIPLLRTALKKLAFHRGGGTILLDGAPVSLTQNDLLDELPAAEFPKPTQVVLLDCDEHTMIQRCLQRGQDAPNGNKRDDDEEETVGKTAAVFRKHGDKIANHFDELGLLSRIDTGPNVTEEDAYAALKKNLVDAMTAAGHWDATGQDPTRPKLTPTAIVYTDAKGLHAGDMPAEPAIRLRVSAYRSGLATTTRTLIGVMRWRAKAKRALVVMGAVAEVAEEPQDDDEDVGPGGLTVVV